MTSGNYTAVKIERNGHIATITLNRPERMNAVNSVLADDFHRALDELAEEIDIRVIIVTGEGRGFCAGADVNQMADSLDGRSTKFESKYASGVSPLAPHLRSIPQPVIAAVNGVAAGGGFGIALACDMRIASENARFGCVFVKRSLVPDTGTSYTTPGLVGMGVAMEMALTGNVYDAQWALEKGLVNKVVPEDQLMSEAFQLAEDIASNPPIAVRSIKQLMYAHSLDLDPVYKQERAANAPAADSEDRREAVRSFVEKRKPVYKGR